MKNVSTGTTVVRSLAGSILRAFGPTGVRASEILLENNDAQYLSYIESLPGPLDNGFDGDTYFVSEFLSKAEFLRLGIDRKEVALQSFLSSEDLCAQTNKRVLLRHSEGFNLPCSASHLVLSVRWKISQILREFNWDEVIKRVGFGPGAAVGVPRRKACAAYKYGHVRPTVTAGSLETSRIMLKWFDLWGMNLSEHEFEIVPGNKVVTVPKNYKTDRTIAIEPLMNSFIQKGIGGVIRRKLSKCGVDLNDQTRNQVLAKIGSETGHLATLDLKGASDSLASWVVFELLPPDWFNPMNSVRSEYGVLPSQALIRYEKFSSMGNGYTFELESLIFFAILAVCRDLVGRKDDVVSVYGDDLIVPCSWAEVALEVLRWFGFQPNLKKSFKEGGFRESCGKHYLNGVDITPLYIRKDVASPERLIWLANSLRRLAHRRAGGYYGLDSAIKPAYDHIVSSLPEDTPLISEGFGDGGLSVDFDVAHPSSAGHSKKWRGWEGWATSHWVRSYKKYVPGGVGRLISELMRLTTEAGSSGFCDDSRVRPDVFPESLNGSYTLVRRPLVIPQWRDLGPWI